MDLLLQKPLHTSLLKSIFRNSAEFRVYPHLANKRNENQPYCINWCAYFNSKFGLVTYNGV